MKMSSDAFIMGKISRLTTLDRYQSIAAECSVFRTTDQEAYDTCRLIFRQAPTCNES